MMYFARLLLIKSKIIKLISQSKLKAKQLPNAFSNMKVYCFMNINF